MKCDVKKVLMVSLSELTFDDLWSLGRINIDKWTETFSTQFYYYYIGQYTSMSWKVSNNSDVPVGYIIGTKYEGDDCKRCQIVAVTVCEEFRRLGLASYLIRFFENVADVFYQALCTGLYVRLENFNAQTLYSKLGYTEYRRIQNYYSSIGEDGIELRRPLPRDTEGKSCVTERKYITIQELRESERG